MGREVGPAAGVDGDSGEKGRELAGESGAADRVGVESANVGGGTSGRGGGKVRYWMPSFDGLGGIAVSISTSSSMGVASRIPSLSLMMNSFSTSSPSLCTSVAVRSNSHRASSSSTFADKGGGTRGVSALLTPPAGLGGAAEIVLVGTASAFGAMAATGTRRFSVDVCNRPGCRYGPENQATSSLPSGSIVPPRWMGGKTLFGRSAIGEGAGERTKRYCLVSLGISVFVMSAPMGRETSPWTASSWTRSNRMPSVDTFWTRTSSETSVRRMGSSEVFGSCEIWMRVLIASGAFTCSH